MLFIALRFWLPLVLVCGYALVRGGAPERLAAAMLVGAGLLTLAVERQAAVRFSSVELGVMAVDLALLVGLFALSMQANRWWPLLLAAFQLMTLLGHLGKWLNPDLMRLGYAIMLFAPAYPLIAVLAAGTHRHQRRLRRHGVDTAWSG